MSIYPISTEELEAMADALDEAISGGASLGSCVHVVLEKLEAMRSGEAQ